VSRLVARLIVALAAILLPSPLARWGRAMAIEAESIEQRGPRLRFAFGCLGGALSEALSFHVQRPPFTSKRGEIETMTTSEHLRPRLLTIACAVGAVGLGMGYMGAAEAPLSYLAMNGAALLLGLLAIAVAAEAHRIVRVPAGPVVLALACGLLATSLFGTSAEGVTRWVPVGGVMLQPGLIVVPIIAMQFARVPAGLSTLAVSIAALALALQPDRAMAGALAGGMAALALFRPGRDVAVALAAALAAFAATLVRPDVSQASPFVDQIFYSAFEVHVLAGLAVVAGAALMIVPAIAGLLRDPDNRASYAVFGAVWLAVIAAAALGNYPTPLVGYSGSAILGYMVSVIGLPPRTGGRPRRPVLFPRRSGLDGQSVDTLRKQVC
jgi:cell division protein FtsW (lipid II flippase)